MAEWTKVGINVVTGAAAGAVDQLVQNQDDKRAGEKQAAGETLGIMAQYGTYLNYGVPLLSIIASAMGWLRGEWADRAILVGSQLAGRKATWQFTKRTEVPGYAFTKWQPSPEARQAALVEKARREFEARAKLAGAKTQVSEFAIPVIVGGKGLA